MLEQLAGLRYIIGNFHHLYKYNTIHLPALQVSLVSLFSYEKSLRVVCKKLQMQPALALRISFLINDKGPKPGESPTGIGNVNAMQVTLYIQQHSSLACNRNEFK